jgi:hypothetical protein
MNEPRARLGSAGTEYWVEQRGGGGGGGRGLLRFTAVITA